MKAFNAVNGESPIEEVDEACFASVEAWLNRFLQRTIRKSMAFAVYRSCEDKCEQGGWAV